VTTRPAAGAVHAGGPRTACDMLRALAQEDPGHAALRAGGDEWTRAELAAAVDEAALVLRERGVRVGDPVAIQAPRSAGSVIATLAVLQLGAAVAPLGARSTASPRTREAISALAPRLTITDDFDGLPSVIPLPEVAGCARHSASGRPVTSASPGPSLDDLAYVLHTSGTTGRSKAVLVPHRALTDRLAWGQLLYPIGPDDVVLHWAAPVFDFAFWELLAPLCFGATVIVAPEEAVAEPALLGKIIRDERVSCVHFVPSLLEDFLTSGVGECLGGVRYLFCGGETLSPALARDLLKVTPGQVFNQYGPTEACIDCTAWEVSLRDVAASVIPIGRPRGNACTRVMDEMLCDVPAGDIGTLCVGGTGLAWGYLGAGAETAEAFFPDPCADVPGARLYRTGDRVRERADGVLEFIGRADRQVKIRGVRIELDEVETVLRRHPKISQAAVVERGGDGDGTRIIAHLVSFGGAVVVDELRAFLASWLPAAAIPDGFSFNDELPRLVSGKLDRQAVASLSAESAGTGRDVPAEREGEATETEQRLMALWAKLMKVDRVRLADDFFDIGGHSLLAMRMLARIWVAFHVRLPTRVIFDAPTVASLAAAIDHAVEAAGIRRQSDA
jgi:amino acid adenylation domain-containing protein